MVKIDNIFININLLLLRSETQVELIYIYNIIQYKQINQILILKIIVVILK